MFKVSSIAALLIAAWAVMSKKRLLGKSKGSLKAIR